VNHVPRQEIDPKLTSFFYIFAATQQSRDGSERLESLIHRFGAVSGGILMLLLSKSRAPSWFGAVRIDIALWLDSERNQLPLWIPVGLGIGAIIWEHFGNDALWVILGICASLFAMSFMFERAGQAGSVVRWAAICIVAGFLAIFIRSANIAEPPLEKINISEFYGRIVKVEHISARDVVRLELETGRHNGLPRKIRVNLSPEKYQEAFKPGAIIRLRARLMPPAGPTVPGAYDFSRRAWFSGIGATGTALGEVALYKASGNIPLLVTARRQLSNHIASRLPDDSGAIAAALVTGEQGAINEADAQAMRDSGLAHLLSISGLHVTAVVGAIFFLVSRLLSLFPFIALRIPIPLIAAGVAAVGAIAYTMLTGAEVPTVRSCVAALLILTALALGRDALSLRLVCFGATVVLLFWPEALAGPSFQLSFAAVSTIIILHESKWMRQFAQRREEGLFWRLGRGVVLLLLTGLAIELILAPITLHHFHKAGLYGALANIVAIPLTTFIIMPFEALALLFDVVGLGAPFWWIAGQGIDLILYIARSVSGLPGAVSMLPMMPGWAFASIVFGALWFGIFQTRVRYVGGILFLAGLAGMISAPYPDILVTGDGKHLAVVDADGRLALLRERTGDYVRDTLRENAGVEAEPIAIEDWPGVHCSADACIITLDRGGRRWNLMAIRSRYNIPSMELAAACKRVDIVVSDRWLPRSCQPKWIKADRNSLAATGGLSFYLDDARVETVNSRRRHMPWFQDPTLQAGRNKDAIRQLKVVQKRARDIPPPVIDDQ
jgi:competence protein ComEC